MRPPRSSSTLETATTWVCTRRFRCDAAEADAARLHQDADRVASGPKTLRPVSGCVPPIEIFLSAMSVEVV